MLIIRQNLYTKQVRPDWIPDNVMVELERIWNSKEFKTKCEVGEVNQASSKGLTQHKGGSIPNTEHKRRMAVELRRDPTFFKLFKKTHFNEKTGEFVDYRAVAAYTIS